MSEEEKKAIENLKKNRGVSFKEADVLSNLLEKQQKEIEDLNEIKQQICNEELITQDYVQKNFVQKDKIREKMREIMGYTISSSEERHCQNYAYDRLKELLEEN